MEPPTLPTTSTYWSRFQEDFPAQGSGDQPGATLQVCVLKVSSAGEILTADSSPEVTLTVTVASASGWDASLTS